MGGPKKTADVMKEVQPSAYMQQFRGGFKSAMRWHHLDALWATLRAAPEGWFVYHVGDQVPQQPLSAGQFEAFLSEIDELLRREHDEDYCGIVYADSLDAPGMVKIYDPNNLGVSCGFSDNPPLPGWVLSRIAPQELQSNAPLTGSRRRWWKRLFG